MASQKPISNPTAPVAVSLSQKHQPSKMESCEPSGGEISNDMSVNSLNSITNSTEMLSVSSESNSQLPPTVICGPSGVGKGTLLGLLKEKWSDKFGVSVSHTTRPPREGEVNGVNYHFVTVEEFKKKIAAGEFIEYACVHGKYYGTSIQSIKNVADTGRVCLLEIDVAGATIINEKMDKCNFLFITTSETDKMDRLSRIELRLRGRGSEDEASIKKRMETAVTELEFLEKNPEFFCKVLHNDDLEEASQNICNLFEEWYPFLTNEA